jgi:hypothetical protein
LGVTLVIVGAIMQIAGYIVSEREIMKKNCVVILALVGSLYLANGLFILGKYAFDYLGIGRGAGAAMGVHGFRLKDRVTQSDADTSFAEFKKSNPFPPGLSVEMKIIDDGTYVELRRIRQATFYQDTAFLDDVHSWYIDSLVGYPENRGSSRPGSSGVTF